MGRKKIIKKIKNEDHFYEIDNEILLLINIGEYEILKEIIRENFIVDNLTMMGMPLIFYAVKKRNKELVTALLECGSDINLYNTSFRATPIFVAVKNNDIPMIKFLVENGADPYVENGDGYTLAGYAITCRKLEAFEYLLRNYPKLNEDSDILYSLKNNAKFVKALYRNQIINQEWISKDEKTLSELANEFGNQTVIKFVKQICKQ